MNIKVQTLKKGQYSKITSPGFYKKNIPHIHLFDSHKISKEIYQKINSYLNEEEKERAQKFRFEKDRKEFVVARGLLKILIVWYFDKTEKLPFDWWNLSGDQLSSIHFEKGENGKPILKLLEVDQNNLELTSLLQFNVSHSNGFIAIAFGFDDFEIGIDIERIKQPFDYQLIIDNYFSKKEQVYITNEERFFELWTRKEALLKVTGVGLTNDLTQMEVSESGVVSRLTDERFALFMNQSYYLNSFRYDDYWISLATHYVTDFEIFNHQF